LAALPATRLAVPTTPFWLCAVERLRLRLPPPPLELDLRCLVAPLELARDPLLLERDAVLRLRDDALVLDCELFDPELFERELFVPELFDERPLPCLVPEAALLSAMCISLRSRTESSRLGYPSGYAINTQFANATFRSGEPAQQCRRRSKSPRPSAHEARR
jgi:hypothetical protein